MKLPQRVSLVDQVADLLRVDLLAGRWPHELPGEHPLCDQLQVSRSTLRAALELLRKEGLILAGRGRRRRISQRLSGNGPVRSSTVGVISSLPLHRGSARSMLILHELRRHLQQAGLELQMHVVSQTDRAAGRRRLEALMEQTQAACWILSSCSIELQRWFADWGGPTLVIGSCHEGIDLPFVRCDAAVACRHAVGRLRSKGHRRIGLLLPKSAFAGTLEIELSFTQACADLPAGGTQVRFHAGEAADVERAMLAMLKVPDRPTAIITMMPSDALATFSLLQHRRQRIPEDISIVSLFDDPILAYLVPPLTRYAFDSQLFARRLARVAIKLATQSAQPRSVSMLPEFIPGATVGTGA